MNKKFLKGLAALFAVAVLGVSCQSNSNPGGGGDTTKELKISNFTSDVNRLGTQLDIKTAGTSANVHLDLKAALTSLASVNTGIASITVTTGNADDRTTSAKVQQVITQAFSGLNTSNISYAITEKTAPTTGSAGQAGVYTITMKAKKGYKFGSEFKTGSVNGAFKTVSESKVTFELSITIATGQWAS